MARLRYCHEEHMKIFSYFFRPQFIIRDLQKENNALKLEMAQLVDENQSLWDLLDEIKADVATRALMVCKKKADA